MSSGLILILVVAVGYLAARLASDYLASRFLIVSGAEYLILGILLGPRVSGLITTSVLDSFGPFIVLAIGWMGAAVGTQFRLDTMIRIRAGFYQVAFLEALLTLFTVSGVMAAILVWVMHLPLASALMPAAALGAIACATSLSGVSIATQRHTLSRPLAVQLQVAAGMDAAVAIGSFGLLLCLIHLPPPSGARPPTPTEWGVIMVGIGVAGGVLYHLFLAGERNPDRLFIALAGAITLASGAAAYARLSPLLPTMLIGAILANTSRTREPIIQVIEAVQRPLYLVLLIFAGAAWEPSTRLWMIPIAAFLLVRLGTKLGAARLSARASGMFNRLGPDWGRALLGQGALAIAIALNYRIHDSSILPNVVFTATIISVLFTDMFSARLAHAVLLRGRPRPSQAAPVSEPEPGPEPQPAGSPDAP